MNLIKKWRGTLPNYLFFIIIFFSTIYPSPPSILALVTWVPQSKLPAQAGRCASGPRPNQMLQCAASLAAGGYNRPCRPIESLFQQSPARCLIVRRLPTAPSCPTALFFTVFFIVTNFKYVPSRYLDIFQFKMLHFFPKVTQVAITYKGRYKNGKPRLEGIFSPKRLKYTF